MTETSVFHIKARIEDLIPLISQGGGATGRADVHPIYETVLLEVDPKAAPGVVRCVSSDLEIFHTVHRAFDEIEILGAGKLCISKKDLLSLLRDGKKGSCELRGVPVGEDGPTQDLELLMDGSRFVISGQHFQDFPTTPKVEGAGVITIPIDQFYQAVRRTEFSAARERMRYALNGVLLEVEERKTGKGKSEVTEHQCVFVATDGRRLSLVDVDHEQVVDGEVKGIIPTDALRNAIKWIPKKRGEPDLLSGLDSVRVAFDGSYVSISFGDFEVVSRLVEGVFVPYRDVVPADTKYSALFDKADLLTALKHSLRCTTRHAESVRLEMSGRKVKFSSQSSERSFEREVSAHVKGGKLVMGFNPTFLIEGLAVYDGNSVSLCSNGKDSPCKVVYENWTYVVMPVSVE